MSYTSFGVNDAMAVKLWSKYMTVAMRDNLDIAPLMGTDDNSIIHMKEDMKKGTGDKVTCALRARLTGDGITESEVAEGNGESLSIYSDSVTINELGHVVGARSENTIDQQRVPFNLRTQCKDALGEWWADRMSASFFNQVCGYTPQTNTKYTGMNSVTGISSATGLERQIVAAAHANDEDITSGDTFTLEYIDQAVEAAKVGSQKVRPIKIGGQDKYVVYLHPYQVTSLRTASGTTQWNAIQQSALAGGSGSKNPIYTGALGEYNGCILRVSQDVTPGVRSDTGAAISTVRRAVLLGAQSAVCAFGKNGGQDRARWNEELLDHKRKLEVSAWQIWGLKKSVWNSVDFGTVVISTYAAASS